MTAPKLTGDRCRCSACGETFNSTYAFDKHRQGPYTDRRCLTIAAMAERGFRQNSKGFWMTPLRGTPVRQQLVGTQPAVSGARG